jgi:hypothetical protein
MSSIVISALGRASVYPPAGPLRERSNPASTSSLSTCSRNRDEMPAESANCVALTIPPARASRATASAA